MHIFRRHFILLCLLLQSALVHATPAEIEQDLAKMYQNFKESRLLVRNKIQNIIDNNLAENEQVLFESLDTILAELKYSTLSTPSKNHIRSQIAAFTSKWQTRSTATPVITVQSALAQVKDLAPVVNKLEAKKKDATNTVLNLAKNSSSYIPYLFFALLLLPLLFTGNLYRSFSFSRYKRKFDAASAPLFIEIDSKIIWANKSAKKVFNIRRIEAFSKQQLSLIKENVHTYTQANMTIYLCTFEEFDNQVQTNVKMAAVTAAPKPEQNISPLNEMTSKVTYLFESAHIKFKVNASELSSKLSAVQQDLIEEYLRVFHFIAKNQKNANVTLSAKTLANKIELTLNLQASDFKKSALQESFYLRKHGELAISEHLERLESSSKAIGFNRLKFDLDKKSFLIKFSIQEDREMVNLLEHPQTASL